MANPILQYLGGRPMPGTGAAQDYFRQPPDLSYLQDASGYQLPEDSGYAVARPNVRMWDDNQIRAAMSSGRMPTSMRHQLEAEQNAPHGMDDARRRYDAAWAMHYLNKADPTDPRFSEGLARMFQQFPGAAQDPALMNQVNSIMRVAPPSRISPEAADLYKQINSLQMDDPEYAKKHAEIVAAAGPRAWSDPRIASFIERTGQHGMLNAQRAAQMAEKENNDNNRALSFFKKIPEAYQFYNDRVSKGEKSKDVLMSMREAAGFAPTGNDIDEHREFWRRFKAGEDPAALGEEYETRNFLGRNNVTDPAQFGLVDEEGNLDKEKVKEFRDHIRKYGEDPQAAMERYASRKGGSTTFMDKINHELAGISDKLDSDPYTLINKENYKGKLTADQIKEYYEGNEDRVMAEAQAIRKSLMNRANALTHTIRTQGGFRQNELYNHMMGLGFNPEQLGLKRKPFQYEVQPEKKEMPKEPQSTEKQALVPNRQQINILRGLVPGQTISPKVFDKMFGKGSAEKYLNNQ